MDKSDKPFFPFWGFILLFIAVGLPAWLTSLSVDQQSEKRKVLLQQRAEEAKAYCALTYKSDSPEFETCFKVTFRMIQ